LYEKDINSFNAASNALAAAHKNLASAEERWLVLEMQREAS
jgi:hypothetical protein